MTTIFNSQVNPESGALLIKSVIRIPFILLSLFFVLSCSKDDEEQITPASLVLSSSTTTIAADGADEAVFEVKAYDDEDNLISDIEYELYVNDVLIDSDIFSTSETGEYTFYVEVNQVRSNTVVVSAIDPQNARVASVSLETDNQVIIADGNSTSNLSINFYDENGAIVNDVNYRILVNDSNYGSQQFKTLVSGKFELKVIVSNLVSNTVVVEARPEINYEEISIPVVFHIIHYGEAVGSGPNISAAEVDLILEKLNKGFSNGFPSENSNAVDTHIRFRLATLDENNNTMAEPGIDRIDGRQYDIGAQNRTREDEGSVYGPVKHKLYKPSASINLEMMDIPNDRQFGYDEMEAMGDELNWDKKQYYNVYLVSIQDNIEASGFAYYPYMIQPNNVEGLPALSEAGEMYIPNIAPCVIDYEKAAYENSTTIIHEVGHTLGLFHIFSKNECESSDYCDDTYSYVYKYRERSCPGNAVRDQKDNFMDYTSNCTTFTYEQRERMRMVLEYGFFYKDLKYSEK